jgi:MFS family permease
MPYQPAENLTNRTFVGLIIAQFLAGFNDQAIHAAAMFYAIHTVHVLSEADAITLMPILFYSPWAIFCTLAGYFADRYSKTFTLRFWKVSEIVISLCLIVGFYLGSHAEMPVAGGWIVMSSVFMMGMHAAFFAPAKYGAMPEILRPHILSRGNGILESTTFLASILGAVSGGLLYNIFRDNPVVIGVILLVLSIIGAAASFLITWLPSASPDKLFPVNLFKPLIDNLRVMFRSRPLGLAMLGIAFFIFMVSYMRAAVYMHGETRNPRWDEQYTSLIVATVALGVGLGSPLAGYLSGGKVELGLVPLGCLGMIFALLISGAAIEHTPLLVVALIIIGFFSGFYMVPLYTLLQQRAPKKSKGELVATSNFVNVTGAIAASILFNVLVQLGRLTNVTPEIDVKDDVAVGKIGDIKYVAHKHGKIESVIVETKDGQVEFFAKSKKGDDAVRREQEERDGLREWLADLGVGELRDDRILNFQDNFFDVLSEKLKKDDSVRVSKYQQRDVWHYNIRLEGQPLKKIYDNEILPRYLFIGAALMTTGILILLCRKLPDFFVRAVFWFKTLGKFRLRAVGMVNLPTEGPVILVTNCQDMQSALQMVSATDRTTKVILVEEAAAIHDGALLRTLACRANLILVRPEQNVESVWPDAVTTLRGGHLLAVSLAHAEHAADIAALLHKLRAEVHAPVLPVFCGSIDDAAPRVTPRVRVVFGELMDGDWTLEKGTKAITDLGDWIRQHDDQAGTDQH